MASPEETAQEIYSDTMSPFCPGLLLRDCPSDKASQLKLNIKDKLISGSPESEVREWLSSQYGSTLLATPETSGFGLVGWVAPLLFLVIGAVVVWRKVGRAEGNKLKSNHGSR